METVNLAIVAHVDAGKTSLTERLLYDAGVIDALGSVNAGTTQTDSGELERRRGITIRTAVASFTVDDLRVNLIDTPGHVDFVAEVERALSVLDGAVLVVSAVEGVQPHTRALARILTGLRVPTLIFVNKVDRLGARPEGVAADIRTKLGLRVADMTRVTEVAEALAGLDDDLLAALVDGRTPPAATLDGLIARHTAAGDFHPVYCGSAITGAGVAALVDGVSRFLPRPAPEPRLRARVFAIERTARGERGLIRVYGGELLARQRVPVFGAGGGERRGQLTDVEVVGTAGSTASAGDIARVRGVPLRIGDQIGSADGIGEHALFARPSLQTVVRPKDPADGVPLHRALTRLAEADPLIQLRVAGTETSVLLYGEVQKEVIAATLAAEFGVEATFERSRPVYLERPVGMGHFVEGPDRYWVARVGLRIEPGAPGSGVTYRLEVELGALPLSFHRAIEETARAALEQGLHGWPVTDVVVTLTDTWYSSPVTVAGDFRAVTPYVTLQALADARTRVFEPCHAFTLDVPADRIGPVLARLAHLGAVIGGSESRAGAEWRVEGSMPARAVPSFTQELPGLSAGDGAWLSRPEGDRAITGRPPERTRTDGNPVDRDAYVLHLSRRVAVGG